VFSDGSGASLLHATLAAGEFTWTNIVGAIDAEVICWAPNNLARSHGYEGGLFMGKDQQYPGTCHIDNDPGATELKSHYTRSGAWYAGQHSLLKASNAGAQLPYGKIAIWVRASA
jgi:hypothetical protein